MPRRCKTTEDRAITEAVRHQEAVGLQSITDGEFRRDWWHLDFLAQLDGVTLQQNPGPKFNADGHEQPPIATVTGRVACSKPIMADDFAFLKSVTSRSAKMTIPSPSMLHLRGGRAAISKQVYPDLAEFWADVAAAYRAAIGHLYAAGCRYLQLDDITFAYLCDPKIQATCRANGDDPAALAADLRRHDQRGAGRPAGRPARDDPHLPRQLQERLGRRRRLRPGGRGDVLDPGRRLLHGVRQRPRRRFRAAAACCSKAATRTRRSCSAWSRPSSASSKPRTP